MRISISGQHITIGDSLRQYMEDKINEIILKYYDDVIKVDVHLDKDGSNYKCEIEVHNGNGKNLNLNSHGNSNDIYAAFDDAMNKTETQLRKLKSKLKDHDRTKNL